MVRQSDLIVNNGAPILDIIHFVHRIYICNKKRYLNKPNPSQEIFLIFEKMSRGKRKPFLILGVALLFWNCTAAVFYSCFYCPAKFLCLAYKALVRVWSSSQKSQESWQNISLFVCCLRMLGVCTGFSIFGTTHRIIPKIFHFNIEYQKSLDYYCKTQKIWSWILMAPQICNNNSNYWNLKFIVRVLTQKRRGIHSK